MKGNTTTGDVVNGVARQVKMPSYWLSDVFAVIPSVQLMLAKTKPTSCFSYVKLVTKGAAYAVNRRYFGESLWVHELK